MWIFVDFSKQRKREANRTKPRKLLNWGNEFLLSVVDYIGGKNYNLLPFVKRQLNF
jgi:hypothetical protein